MHVSKQVWGECCLLRGAPSKWMSTEREQLELLQPALQSKYVKRATACSMTLQVNLIDYNSLYYLLPGGNAEQAKCVRLSVAVSLLL